MLVMDVSPRTLREVEFREKLRGYHPDDVDEFLERVAAGLEMLQDKLREATERANRAEQRVAEVSEGDDALRRTLQLAQRTADLAVQESKEQAAHIVAEAEEEARRVLAAAEEHVGEMIRTGQAQLREDIARLESARAQMAGELNALARYLEEERNRLRRALTEAIGHVEQSVPAVQPPPVFPPLDLPPEGFAPPAALPTDTEGLVYPQP